MGYDISNYEEVYAPYGTMKDMDDLIEACHSRFDQPDHYPTVHRPLSHIPYVRGMKLILDLVINLSADRHG